MSERFEGLTPHQTEVLGQIAMGNDGGHHRATLRLLEKKGLIEGRDVTLRGWPPVTVKHYSVPVHVHIRYCEWASQHFGECRQCHGDAPPPAPPLSPKKLDLSSCR
jgi:hypothetical protein